MSMFLSVVGPSSRSKFLQREVGTVGPEIVSVIH